MGGEKHILSHLEVNITSLSISIFPLPILHAGNAALGTFDGIMEISREFSRSRDLA